MKLSRFVMLGIFMLVSCVGTVQETTKEITYGEKLPSQSFLSFGGVAKVVPVSHSRLEVYFYPATGGSEDYSYLIYNSESDQPITVNEQSIFRAYGGYYMYTLTGLEQGGLYSIRVDAKDNKDDTIFQTDKYIEEKTFSNRVADFHGISGVTNASGVAGLDSIVVTWPQATIPTSILEGDFTTKEYRIIVLDSTNNGSTPNQLHDKNVTKEEGRIVYSVQIPSGSEWNPLVDSYMVTGLQENSVYYVGVQCVHKSSLEDPNNPDLFGERNNRWIQIKTLTSNFNNISLPPGSLEASPASGAQAYSSINIKWGLLNGIYDHLRVYYGLNGASNNGPCLAGSCKKVSSNENLSTTIADLEPDQDYEFKLVVCADVICETNKLLGIAYAPTRPNVGTFNGITNIFPPQNIAQLETFTINFAQPDFSAGYFEGLRLFYVKPSESLTFLQWRNGSSVEPTLYVVGQEPSNSLSLYHEYFSMNLQTSFSVLGVSSQNSDDQHCFALIPFNTNSEGEKENLIEPVSANWMCTTYNPRVPTEAAFVGLTSAATLQNQISLQWDTPASGLYSHFAVFIKKGGGAFSYTDALGDSDLYERILLPIETMGDEEVEPLTSYAIQNLENDTYLVGIRTFYMANGEYSESEDVIYECDVSGANNSAVPCDLLGN